MAAANRLAAPASSIRSGVEVQDWTPDVEDGQSTEYETTVEVAFAVHPDVQHGESSGRRGLVRHWSHHARRSPMRVRRDCTDPVSADEREVTSTDQQGQPRLLERYPEPIPVAPTLTLPGMCGVAVALWRPTPTTY